MKPNSFECRKQAQAASEANIHKASFFERRLFYLIGMLSHAPRKTLLEACGIVL